MVWFKTDENRIITEYILFRDVEHSGPGSAPESVPTIPGISSHQFLSYTESVNTNSYRFPELHRQEIDS
jgi:hypothetical protein